MRYILSFLLFCLIFQNIVSQKLSRVQLTTIGLFLSEHKQKLRKLQNTDTTEDTSGPTLPEAEPYTMPQPGKPENVPATAKNSEVPFNTTVSSVPKRTGNKKAPVQFSKFYGFIPGPNGRGLFKFKVLFFLMRIIPKYIIFRLRITYGARLRNLALGDSGTAESVRSDCTADESKVGDDASSTGENVKFTCEANSTGDVSTANVQVNTDVPLTIVEADGSTSTLGFDNINFNGNAADEAANLGKVQDLSEWWILKETVASIDGQYLVLSGTFQRQQDLRRLALSESDPIIMQLSNQNNENSAADSYSCNYVAGSPEQLRCDASNKKLSTTVAELHASLGTPKSTNGTLVQVEMKDPDSPESIEVGGGGSGSNTYRKSSSGLSGGAIAGIVIACVVVLVAAAIAAIMLRKPTPPVENTTVAELRTDNI